MDLYTKHALQREKVCKPSAFAGNKRKRTMSQKDKTPSKQLKKAKTTKVRVHPAPHVEAQYARKATHDVIDLCDEQDDKAHPAALLAEKQGWKDVEQDIPRGVTGYPSLQPMGSPSDRLGPPMNSVPQHSSEWGGFPNQQYISQLQLASHLQYPQPNPGRALRLPIQGGAPNIIGTLPAGWKGDVQDMQNIPWWYEHQWQPGLRQQGDPGPSPHILSHPLAHPVGEMAHASAGTPFPSSSQTGYNSFEPFPHNVAPGLQPRLDPTFNTPAAGGMPNFKPKTIDLTQNSPTLPTQSQQPLANTPAALTAPAPSANPSAPPQPVAEIEPALCREQAELVNLICSGQNVFYTGSAGCGKSTVLKAFVKRLRSNPDRRTNIQIVAPTGRAALDIGGSTFWTFAGWTPDHMKKPLQELKKQAHGKFVNKRLRETDLLVIDEISMMENHHFERLNAYMKEARGSSRAFGGVQLVVTGDFCQLPPVKPFAYCMHCGQQLIAHPDGTSYKCTDHGECKDTDKWAFRSAAWEECRFNHVNLTTIHRQSDRTFIDILQNCRLGTQLTPIEVDTLLNHESNTYNAVKLFSTRDEVRRVNQAQFQKLRSREYRFMCLDDFRHNPKHGNLAFKGKRNELDNSLDALRDHRFEIAVSLKQGMLVVLQINLDLASGLVNGSQGQITGWEDYDPAKLPKATERGNSSRKNGSADRAFTLGGQTLGGEYAIIREDYIAQFIRQAKDKRWPIVRFQNGVTRTIYADCGLSELGDEKPYSLLSRTQIPLLPAWAMSVHKSQGMTLDRVIVDLGRAFEEGQGYVALSRARSLEGLKVEALGPLGTAEGGNKQVKEFLKAKFGIV